MFACFWGGATAVGFNKSIVFGSCLKGLGFILEHHGRCCCCCCRGCGRREGYCAGTWGRRGSVSLPGSKDWSLLFDSFNIKRVLYVSEGVGAFCGRARRACVNLCTLSVHANQSTKADTSDRCNFRTFKTNLLSIFIQQSDCINKSTHNNHAVEALCDAVCRWLQLSGPIKQTVETGRTNVQLFHHEAT